MHHPRSHLVSLKYAEMLYSTQRDRLNDLYDARKYFSHAALLKEDAKDPCVRALFGIVKTCKAIKTVARKTDAINDEMLQTAQQ
jgi:hypothetical protein